MTRAAVVLAVVSALCLGASFGFMGGVMFSRHVLHGGPGMGFQRLMEHAGPGRWQPHGPPGHRGLPSPRALLPRLQRLLDLTPVQADAIRAELERSRGDFDQVRDSLHTRIERHLTAGQRARWRHLAGEQEPGETRGLDRRTLRAEPGREGEATR